MVDEAQHTSAESPPVPGHPDHPNNSNKPNTTSPIPPMVLTEWMDKDNIFSDPSSSASSSSSSSVFSDPVGVDVVSSSSPSPLTALMDFISKCLKHDPTLRATVYCIRYHIYYTDLLRETKTCILLL